MKSQEPKNKGEIVIYQNEAGLSEIDVKLAEETVWLTQKQIALLFGKDRKTVTEHINNILKEEELEENSTSRKFQQVRLEGSREISRSIQFYNLDMIISVGYRVNSKRGTQFRIWATKVLKEHIVKGYSINQKRLNELSQNIEIVKRTVENLELKSEEKSELLNIIVNYTKSWVLLNKYDKDELETSNETSEISSLDYGEVKKAIKELKAQLMNRGEAGDIFGNEIRSSLEGILNTINQTFDGKDLYKSIEEKAAHLLYFVIKDHPFSDGNKRIGSLIFLIYLNKNKYLYKSNGENKINDNALVTLALLIAQSDPAEKESLVALVMNLLVE